MCNSFLVFFLQLNHQELLWDLWTRRCFIFVPFLFWHCFQHCYLRRDSNIYINDVETLYIKFFVIFSCERDFFVTEVFSCDRAEVTLEAMDWGARCRSGGIYSKWFLKEVESAFFHFWKETLSKVKNIFHFQSNCVIIHLCFWVEHLFLLESNFGLYIFFVSYVN